MPAVFKQFAETTQLLEKHYKDMQDLEFTVERGKLWMLQTRNGKRTARAALRVAVEMANEGLISREDAVTRVDPAALDQLLHPTLDPKAKPTALATGLPASPGAASGEIVFSADEAQSLRQAGRKSILVRVETSPEDIHGMHAAEGVVTTRGGMTSHAAVVARGMGKPCVSGVGSIRIDYNAQTMTAGGVTLKKGDILTIDGGSGEVMQGAAPMVKPELTGDFATLMDVGGCGQADEGARQRRNASRRARRPLVRRRGHRPLPHRAHVLRRRANRRGARDDPRRHRAGTARRARQAPADAAPGLRRAVRDHDRPAGHDPPARSAAARIPAEDRRGGRGGRQGDEGQRRQIARAFGRAARVQSDARLPRRPSRHPLSRDRRDAGARDLRGRGPGGAKDRRAGDRGDHGAAGHRAPRARRGQGDRRRAWARRSPRRPASRSPIRSAR